MMFELQNLDETSIRKYGHELFVYCQKNCSSFEQASYTLVNNLFHDFRTRDGESGFALVRVFRATTYQELLPELQASVKVETDYYLSLMASMGLEEAWCDRRTSRTRKVIPVNHTMSPMFQGVFNALGLKWDNLADDVPDAIADLNMPIVKYFYVPEAAETDYITDKTGFVEPYGIRSVIALGSQFGSGSAYTLICFAREYVDKHAVRNFAQITAYASTVLALFDSRGKLWE